MDDLSSPINSIRPRQLIKMTLQSAIDLILNNKMMCRVLSEGPTRLYGEYRSGVQVMKIVVENDRVVMAAIERE